MSRLLRVFAYPFVSASAFDDPSFTTKIRSVTLFVGIKDGRYRIITAMMRESVPSPASKR